MSHDILNYITTTKDVNKIGFEDHVVADAVHQYVNASTSSWTDILYLKYLITPIN